MVLEMTCDRCGKPVSASDGEYIFVQDKMMFTCKACAKQVDDEIKSARKICSAVDSKKTQAEYVINNGDAFEEF